ncbi:hypothetical protein HUU59_10680 [bacterium]|nr:hypothetical protein [bacterium]
MKSKKDNPLIRFVNQGKVDLVIAPSMALIGRFGMRGQRDLLVNQHLDGVQRVGIVPSIGVTDTNYLVAQVFPIIGDRPQSSLKRALRLVNAFRQEHVVFSALSNDSDECTLATTTYDIPTHLERSALLNEDMFQVWLLFEREIDLGRSWLTLQALLLSMGLDTGVRVLPYPHFRTQQHIEDVVWLPYFNGKSEIIGSQILGGTKNGCSAMLDTSNKSPTRLAQLPSVLDEISVKEFGRLFDIAEPFLEVARDFIPRWPSTPGSQSTPQYSVGSNISLDYFDPDQGQVDNPSAHSVVPPSWSNNASTDSEDSRRKPNLRVWHAIYNSVRKSLARAGILFLGDPLAESIEAARPILRSQVLTFSEQHLGYWRDAVEDILGVESQWTENLIWEELCNLNLKSIALKPILMRVRAARLSDLRVALILIQWLEANGGEFWAVEGGCKLRFEGNDYTIACTPSFSALIWRLTQDTGEPLQLSNEISNAMQSEALVRAGFHKVVVAGRSQAEAHSKDNISEIAIIRAVRELFKFAIFSVEAPEAAGMNFIKVETSPEQVTISGTVDNLCIVLNRMLPNTIVSAPASLVALLREGTKELMGIGVTWEEISIGRGKRREIRLKQAKP